MFTKHVERRRDAEDFTAPSGTGLGGSPTRVHWMLSRIPLIINVVAAQYLVISRVHFSKACNITSPLCLRDNNTHTTVQPTSFSLKESLHQAFSSIVQFFFTLFQSELRSRSLLNMALRSFSLISSLLIGCHARSHAKPRSLLDNNPVYTLTADAQGSSYPVVELFSSVSGTSPQTLVAEYV